MQTVSVRRQFAWNAKASFLSKERKKHEKKNTIIFPCAELAAAELFQRWYRSLIALDISNQCRLELPPFLSD